MTTKTKWYLKVTDEHGKPCNGGHGTYNLPGWSAGLWHAKRNPILCQRGWHVTDLKHLRSWCQRDCRIFVVETMGSSVGSMNIDGKMAFENVRFLFEVEHWMITDAIKATLRGSSTTYKNRLINEVLDYGDGMLYFVIEKFPAVARQLERIIEKQIKNYI